MSNHSSLSSKFLAAGIGIIALVLVALFIYKYENHPAPANPPRQVHLIFGYLVAGPLYTVPVTGTSSTTQPTFFALPTAPSRAILGLVEDATTTYYLIQDPSGTSSNLFSAENSDPTHALTQLTHSATLKFNLSYDPISRKFVYQTTQYTLKENLNNPSIPWLITAYSLVAGKEFTVDTAQYPMILPGGFVMLDEASSTIKDVNLYHRTQATILNNPAATSFAVSGDGSTLAMYNPATKAIDYYAIKNQAYVSYVKSTPISFMPSALGYDGSELFIAGPVISDDTEYYLQMAGDSAPRIMKEPAPGFAPRTFYFTHD